MKKLLAEYENYLKTSMSNNTVDSYIRDITKFLNEAGVHKKRELSLLDEQNVNKYIDSLIKKGSAYASAARSVVSLRNFFNFCFDNKVLKSVVNVNLEIPVQKRPLPDTISFEEVVAILDSPDAKTVKGMRDKALLELMYATGAKVSEIISLRITDIGLKNEIVVISSAKKNRFVPMGKACVEALSLYLKEGRPKIPSAESTDKLFVNFYGEPLSRQGCWKIIKKYIEKAGVRGNVTAQTIRHSFALHLLSNGADAQSVSEMMGYSDVYSTKIYMDVLNNKIKNVYKNSHPRA